MDEPSTTFVDVDGLRLAVHEWAGAGAPVVLLHATGLSGRTWAPVVERLPGDVRPIAIDLRGHGLSDGPDPVPDRSHWRVFGEDVARVLEALDLREVTLVGHSMGGHTAAVAAVEAPERVARLVLFDPTFTPPREADAPLPPVAAEQPASRRRNEWPSPEAFYERLRGSPPFAAWDEATLRAYTTHGLRRSGDGYVLACPPLFEASVYAGRDDACIDDDLPRIEAPTHVVLARPRRPEEPPGLTATVTRPEALALLRSVTTRQLPDASHFFPQEAPDVAAAAIVEAMQPSENER